MAGFNRNQVADINRNARPNSSESAVVARGRRFFSKADKQRILQAADRCSVPGEIGALMRREGVYSSNLSTWRHDARTHCRAFYNTVHRHSGIAYMTPHSVHHGQAGTMQATRQSALDDAFLKNPNRFKGKNPRPIALPRAVWINPPADEKSAPQQSMNCSLNS